MTLLHVLCAVVLLFKLVLHALCRVLQFCISTQLFWVRPPHKCAAVLLYAQATAWYANCTILELNCCRAHKQ
jgi:hypothetical protein